MTTDICIIILGVSVTINSLLLLKVQRDLKFQHDVNRMLFNAINRMSRRNVARDN